MSPRLDERFDSSVVDELHAEGVHEGAGEDDVDGLDGDGREVPSEVMGIERET